MVLLLAQALRPDEMTGRLPGLVATSGAVVAAFAGYHLIAHGWLDAKWTLVASVALAVMAGWFALLLADIVEANHSNPAQWDFLAFWHWGTAATDGHNLFTATGLQSVELPIEPTMAYTEQITDAGFFYPPPTVFLFSPLGFLNYQDAYLFWMTLHACAALGAIYLLWTQLLDRRLVAGLFFGATLFLMLPGSEANMTFAQTNFLALLLMLLAWKDYPTRRAGMWIGLSILVKPFLVGLLIVPLLQRSSRTIQGVALSAAVSVVAFVLTFGLDTFIDYFTETPFRNSPRYVYYETVNQSLLAQLLRASGADEGSSFAGAYLVFILVAIAMLITVGSLVMRLGRDHKLLALSLALLTGLLLYPGTLSHGGALLVAPLLVLYSYERKGRDAIPWLTLTLALIAILVPESRIFYSFAMYWLACLAVAAQHADPRHPTRSRAVRGRRDQAISR